VTQLVAVHGVLPPYRYAQAELTEAFVDACGFDPAQAALTRRFHASSTVQHRHLALPVERYAGLADFTATNDAFIEAALDLGAEAITGALEQAELRARDVDLVISTTVTGLAVPSLEARLSGRLGLRPDVKRMPLMGLGCVAGAAGIARMHDYLLAWPDQVVVLLAVELCSLTTQRADPAVANLVASALFGDGAAAVVGVGAERASAHASSGPTVVATRSRMYPDTERAMGWDVGSWGFKIVLDAEVPDLVERYLADDVDDFLADHDLKASDVEAWVCHPGGPKVLEAVRSALQLEPGALDVTWRSLADIGNLSSASVLHVLRDTLREGPPAPGTPGVMISMGPGFCCELVLLRW
jgi:alkylresorcinol/alkylpyrone synthase